MIQRSMLPVLALALLALAVPAAGAAEGKTPADTNKEAKSGEGEKGKEAAKKDPKEMNADEAEAAGLCPVCKKEHKLIYRVTIGEKDYHFATRDCKKAFEAGPNKYIAGAAGAGSKKDGEAKKMPPEKEAKAEATNAKTEKTEAVEKSTMTEKTEKSEDGDAMGGGMMGGDDMMGE